VFVNIKAARFPRESSSLCLCTEGRPLFFDLRNSKEKAQLAPGFPTIRDLGLIGYYTAIQSAVQVHFSEETLRGRNGPAMMASGIITSKSRSHFTHLTN
jgi:hypothetical protein